MVEIEEIRPGSIAEELGIEGGDFIVSVNQKEINDALDYKFYITNEEIDLGNLNNSLSVIPSGQRGVSTSVHYTDQLEMFLRGEYHPQYFLVDDVEDFQEAWIESAIYMKSGGN